MSRRGLYLICFGLLHIFLGLAVLAQVADPKDVVSLAIGQVVPPPVYGPASIIGGTICILLPFAKRRQIAGKIGFALLAVLLVARSAAHIWAMLLSLTEGVVLGNGPNPIYAEINPLQQLATAGVYFIVVVVHLIVAGWPEETNLRPLTAYDSDPVRFTEDVFTVMAAQLLEREAESSRDRRQLETDLTEIAQYGRLLTPEERMTQAEDPIGRSTGRRAGQANERAALHEGEETP